MSHFHAVIFGEKMNSVSQYVGLNKVHDHMIRIDCLYILYVDFCLLAHALLESIAHTWKERQLCTEDWTQAMDSLPELW